MSNNDADYDTENPQCPECGGDTVKIKSTVALTTFSCADCEWLEKVKTGSYL